jgi:hypothetical protein
LFVCAAGAAVLPVRWSSFVQLLSFPIMTSFVAVCFIIRARPISGLTYEFLPLSLLLKSGEDLVLLIISPDLLANFPPTVSSFDKDRLSRTCHRSSAAIAKGRGSFLNIAMKMFPQQMPLSSHMISA